MSDEPSGLACKPLQPGAHSFDVGVLGALFDQDPVVIAAVLQTFHDSMQGQLQRMQDAVARRDAPLLADVAHRITGAARMSGAVALAQLSGQLEHAAKTACVDDCVPLSVELWQQWLCLQQDHGFCRAMQGATAA